MGDWKNWSDGWLKEGHYLSYRGDGVTYYERVIAKDLAHYEYEWPETISSGSMSGPYIPDALEVTKGYQEATSINTIWQLIFGINGQVYIYVQLPTDLKRHGLPKMPWPRSENRKVAHFEEWMSPYKEPTFLTEHFMKRLVTYQIDFSAYNPQTIDMPDVWLNIFLSKLETERIGTESYSAAGLQLNETKPHLKEVLKRLYQQLIPCRPLTIEPVRAPATASRAG